MPEKEGAEEKTTKSDVSKKQKQMMGEEGYDIARDMGKVRPSKDKKDATTMPASKEMKKTQKVNKGPSAFERVKAKYGKSVMNVGKKKANEEFDLTQVAEALGGYITEVEIKGEGPIKKIVRDLKKKGEIDPQADKPVSQQTGDKKRLGRKSLTGNIPPEERGGEVDKDPDTEVRRRELSAQQDDKVKGEVSKQAKADAATDNLISKIRQGKTKSGEDASKVTPRPAERVQGASGEKPTGSIARGTYKSSPEGQKAYDAAKRDIEARQESKLLVVLVT